MDETDQITRLYEDGVPPDVIAEALNITTDRVNASLFANCPKFRLEIRRPDSTKPVVEEMLDIIIEHARNLKDSRLSLEAAKFVRDDLKGRRDAIAIDAGHNAEALKLLQANMARLKENKQKFLEQRHEVITIEASCGGN